MGKLIRYFVLSVILLCAVFSLANAQGTDAELRKQMYEKGAGLASNASGYDFYVAIAPNCSEYFNSYPYLKLYVSSLENTEVDMYYAGNKIETFKLTPYLVKAIRLDYRKCEIRKSETPLKQMYRFVSKNAPISVYELNVKESTSEGAMFLPVNVYGKEYIHNSYWDDGSWYKGGFIVMCPEDSTTVTINLKSAQKETWGKTDKGRVPGESWIVKLNKGECYKVCTDGEAYGRFDISGTKITSDKPIGLVSFHEGATIPKLIYGSSNHLVEALPPTNTWGLETYSVPFNRLKNSGDLFRIICKDSNTTWHAEWYDQKYGLRKGEANGTLKESGDFVELIDQPWGRPNITFQSVNGVSRFWADKPILVFQYSFSPQMDSAGLFDPLYITLCPIENYINNTSFQTPGVYDISDNWYSLLALGDSSDAENNAKLLGSIKIMMKFTSEVDTLQVVKVYPQFLTNRIPGTNIYWANISIGSGSYSIKGDTKFGGYLYGYYSCQSYGWPAGTSFSNIRERDFYPPNIEHIGKQCAIWTLHITEKNVDKPSSDPNSIRQVDLGVIEAPSLIDGSFNAIIEFPNFGGVFPINNPQYDFSFTLKPYNSHKDMFAIVAVKDRAGNVSYDTVYYFAPIISSTPTDNIDFGKQNRLNNKISKSIFIMNTSTSIIDIYGIYLKNNNQNLDGKAFKITKGEYKINLSTPFSLAIGESRVIIVQFNANSDNVSEIDSIMVLTKCDVSYAYPVKGKATMPVIKVSDCNFGEVAINESKNSTNSISISNIGTDTLTVIGVTQTSPALQFKTNSCLTPIIFPLIIAPGQQTILSDFGMFTPKKCEKYSTNIIFSHNGDHDVTGDSVSVWTGVGVDPAGVNDARQSSGLRISPNPISLGKFTIDLSNDNDSEISNIEIIDESGKVVKTVADITLNSGKVNVDIPDLAPGSYFVKIKTANIEYIEKIAVVK